MDALSILQEIHFPFPYGLGLHKAGSAQLPCALCVCTLTALMSQFSELPTQASQPAATTPAILQEVADITNLVTLELGRVTKLLYCGHHKMGNYFNCS